MIPVIEVSNLTKHFKDLTVVDGLSFTVCKGDVYGFLGQNGAGKSTTIRMLLTLIKPSSGEIRLFGKDLHKERHEILKNVGAVIERPDLYKYLSAGEHLSMFARLSGKSISKSAILQQLERVGLAERAKSKVGSFSQGMKQRLGIAIALVHDPALIILDEPTNGLDPQGIADMRNLLLSLAQDHGKTVLVSSHLLNEIEMIANRILIIDQGKKVIEGDADELLDPAKSIVEIQSEDDEETRKLLYSGEWAPFLQQNTGSNILLMMDRARIPALNAFLVNNDVRVFSIDPRNSLENYFLSVTKANRHVEPAAN